MGWDWNRIEGDRKGRHLRETSEMGLEGKKEKSFVRRSLAISWSLTTRHLDPNDIFHRYYLLASLASQEHDLGVGFGVDSRYRREALGINCRHRYR